MYIKQCFYKEYEMENKFEIYKDMSIHQNAFKYWEGHRQIVTKKVLEEIDDISDSIAIYGAGECNDIDLNDICKRFNKVTLIDIDKNILNRGLNKVELKNKNKINVLEIDLLDIDDSIYEEFELLLKSKASLKKIKKFIIKVANEIEKKQINIPIEIHDVSVCLGVHSQLTYTFMGTLAEYFGNYDIKDIKKIDGNLEYLNNKTAERLNNLIFKYTSEYAFIGLDIMEISKSLKTDIYIPQLLEHINKSNFKGLSEIVYRCPVRGSYECLNDILKRINQEKINQQCINYYIWPFDELKSYVFYLMTEKIKK